MAKHNIFTMSFSKIYPLYIAKAEKKGRSKEEVDEIICWLTGYSKRELEVCINEEVDVENFFKNAPQFNPESAQIKGLVCGIRVEEIENPMMQKVRYLDKLIDELAKGKKMEKILRRK